jgi:hypothetical protein
MSENEVTPKITNGGASSQAGPVSQGMSLTLRRLRWVVALGGEGFSNIFLFSIDSE